MSKRSRVMVGLGAALAVGLLLVGSFLMGRTWGRAEARPYLMRADLLLKYDAELLDRAAKRHAQFEQMLQACE